MKVVGFITEYNPFHFGHKYHLENSIKETNATHSLAIMSGSFLQRGEPSLVDKWTKAKMAVDNGVDLVLELPFVYSTQSAEYFAYGGVSLMDSLNIVNYISFGSEVGEIQPLSKIAEILGEEPSFYKERLKYYLSLGLSFSVARSNSLDEYIRKETLDPEHSYKDILNRSNNILGIEYLKAINRLNSQIKPITIKRLGKDYNDKNTIGEFSSATGIRNKILSENLISAKNLIPSKSYYWLDYYLETYGSFNSLENYDLIFQYLLRTCDKNTLAKILDIEDGLENRIISKGEIYYSINDLINSITTKRYPRTRIQRIFIHLLNDLHGETVKRLYKENPPYARVLGANKKGLELLNKIKANSSIPIITKYSDYKKLSNELINEFLNYEEKATDIFFLGISSEKPLCKMDYYISPYIK